MQKYHLTFEQLQRIISFSNELKYPMEKLNILLKKLETLRDSDSIVNYYRDLAKNLAATPKRFIYNGAAIELLIFQCLTENYCLLNYEIPSYIKDAIWLYEEADESDFDFILIEAISENSTYKVTHSGDIQIRYKIHAPKNRTEKHSMSVYWSKPF